MTIWEFALLMVLLSKAQVVWRCYRRVTNE